MNIENDAAGFAVLAHKVDAIHSDVGEMRAVLRELTSAIIKLALVEERQSQFALAQERAFKVLEKIETKFEELSERVGALEAAEPMQKQTSTWFMAMVWGAAGVGAMVALNRIGLL